MARVNEPDDPRGRGELYANGKTVVLVVCERRDAEGSARVSPRASGVTNI